VVNLVEEDEKGAGGKSLRSYATLLAGEARSRHIDVSYVRIPIPDVSVPSVSTMRLILGAIDSALDEGRPTYVHCWGGGGRTGTVVGCYLARHRTETDEDALTTIARLRRGEETGSKASPETVEQCDMVRAWAG
jgi:protein-tyrosine phosphatase